MIKYKIKNCPDNCALFLQLFERDFIACLKQTLDTVGGLKCSVNMEFDKINSGKSKILLDSNASFSIKGSLEVQGKLRDLCNQSDSEFDRFIPKGNGLRINLIYSIKEESKESTEAKESIKSEEEPAYVPTTPLYSFDQIILPPEIKEEISAALNVLRYQDLIYNKWGFKEVDPIPKSVINFYGPPGTGKTMSAHAIARELGKSLLALNYAEIESKYVGEAPKNLIKAFNEAKKIDAVLFFDEADSFLGKRIKNVTQGAEQALNSLRSQMLMLLEQHNGIVVFATNLVTNFDSAFESRILKHIKFELPNKEARKAIISKMMPSQLPMKEALSQDQLEELAGICDGFSGRELKGVILETLLDKASKDGGSALFEFEDFKNRFELKKEERKRLKEEADKELKLKITNALNRKANETETSEETNTTKEDVESNVGKEHNIINNEDNKQP